MALFVLAMPGASQTAGGGPDPGRQLDWYTAAGISGLVTNIGEQGSRGLGTVVGAGAEWRNAEAGVIAAFWPEVQSSRIWSVQIQGALPVHVSEGAAVDFVLGTGYISATYLGDLVGVRDVSGINAAMGFRLRFNPAPRWSARVGAFMRTDVGGWNGEWRILIGRRSEDQRTSPNRANDLHVGLRVYYMVPVAGPWEFVRPGYAVYGSMPVSRRLTISLTLASFHWRIPGEAFVRDYLWDTGAFMALPAIDFSLTNIGALVLRAGPALVTMGEGPDAGVNLSPNVELSSTIKLLGWRVELGAGLLWMPRGDHDPRTRGDQFGLMLFSGIER